MNKKQRTYYFVDQSGNMHRSKDLNDNHESTSWLVAFFKTLAMLVVIAGVMFVIWVGYQGITMLLNTLSSIFGG